MTDFAPIQSLAARIADALGGVERQDRPGSWTACCPYHDDSKPSLSITDGDGGRPLLYCFAGCDYEDVIGAIEQRGILADDWQDNLPPAAPRPPPEPPEPNAKALQIWREAWPVKPGGIVDRYLKGRGLMLSIPLSLRETTRLVVKVDNRWREIPAMLSALQIPIEGETFGKLITIQKTPLIVRRTDGSVYHCKRMNAPGSLGNGAVRLGKASEVLGIAEGVETALSAMQLTGIPCWASLGSNRMARVAIPDCVRELHVFGDNDEPGRKAAAQVVDLHTDIGRKVVVRYPPKGSVDWNDALNDYYAPRGLNHWQAIVEHHVGEAT
jgi:putative DNA primase/helicase